MNWAVVWKAVKKFGGPLVLMMVSFLREAENRKKLTEALTWLRRVIGDTMNITESLGLSKRLSHIRGAQKNRSAAKVLIITMKTASPENQQGAAKALVAVGKPAVGLLCKELKDSEPSFRKLVAWALGEIRDIDALVPLVRASGDKDTDTRVIIEEAISKIIDAYSFTEDL